MKRFLLTGLLFVALFALPMQADFFQCPPDCSGSNNADVMNGSPGDDSIEALAGNDIIFGNGGRDELDGDQDNDILFGGPDSDDLDGTGGNDTLIPGPDDEQFFQISFGGEGNDTFIVLVSETVNCQTIVGNEGFDVLHLIGFGPYIAEYPFGAPQPIEDFSYIVIQDPIAGGFIFIEVEDDMGSSIDRITGLPMPNITVLNNADTISFSDQNCVGLI